MDYLHFMGVKAVTSLILAIVLIYGASYHDMPSTEPKVIKVSNGYTVGF